jgi:hypothetical protein
VSYVIGCGGLGVSVIISASAGNGGFSVDRVMKWCRVQCSMRRREATSDPLVGGVVLTKTAFGSTGRRVSVEVGDHPGRNQPE